VKRIGRNILAVVLFVGITLLWGCAVTDWMTGISRNPDGSVVAKDYAPTQGIGDILANFGVYGVSAAAALRWLTVEYRHRAIVKAGQKDDDRDGNVDPPSTPPTAPT
jgi:hypothetical protein